MKKLIAFLFCVVLASGIVMPARAAETTAETTESTAGMDIERIEEEYPDFKKITTKGTFEIPGLRSTPFPDREDCDCMTPQGICVAEDYILITAYCNSYNFVQDILALPDSEQKREWLAREGGHSVHKSVIYVVSKNSYELLNILVLPDDNHVGGIAFDGQLIWIALSKTQKLGVIRFEDLVSTLTNDGDSVEISFYTKVSCDCIASFVTYYDRKLWVGVCDSDNDGIGTMTVFDILGSTVDDLELSGVREFTIPIKANGAAFAQIDGELCLAVNSSYGRDEEKHKSKTHLYSVNFENDYDHGILIDKGLFVLPPMAEEICIDGSDVYTLFESGATPYCTLEGNKCNDVVDRVCIAGLRDWFEWTDSDYQDIEDDYPETEPLIDGMYYNLSDAEDGIYVPNYVTVPDSDKKTETLYNPYTARMALEMSLSAYDLVDADDNDYSWSDSMLKYGYTNIHYFDRGKIMSLGKVIEENGTKKDFFSSVNATLGFKKVRYNGKKKISIVLAFRGTKTLMDGVTDVQIVKDSNGFHDGFAKTAKSCFDSFGEIKLTIDGERVTLADIIESMKDPDSKYCMIVTGHSLGGAVADLFVGHNMYAAGVYPGNVVAYTFAAAGSASSDYRYKYTNIFNLISSDDLVPKLGNDKQIGTNIVYDPDEEFRNKHYPEIDSIEDILERVGIGAFGRLNDVFPAHKLDPVYREIIDIVENDLSQYAPDNVYGFGFNERVNINRNCFCMYEKSVGAKGLGLISANVCINGNLTVGDDSLYMTKDEDYLLIGGNFKTVNAASSYNYLNAGTVELKGDFTDTYSSSFTYGGYREEGTHKTIFSGEGEQRISIDVGKNKNASRFENLVIENPDIYFDTEIYGIRLAADAEITSGTPITVYDHLDLNGYNLKTDGSIRITAYYMTSYPNQGQLYTNGGSFDVKGHISCGYRVLLSENDYKCGSISTAGLSFHRSKLTVSGNMSIAEKGIYMNSDEDYLLVGGNFSTINTESPDPSLSAGTVELKGDFTDTYSVSFTYGGYRESGTHKTIFSGEGEQRISIDVGKNKNASRFENLVIENPDIYFDTEIYGIRLAADAEITSGTPITVYDHLDLNGYNLKTDGSIRITAYYMTSYPNQGQLYTNGGSFDVKGSISCGYRVLLSENDYRCGSISTAGLIFYHSKLTVGGNAVIRQDTCDSGLSMAQEDNYLIVEGNLVCNSEHSSLTSGTIEVKGDLTAQSKSYIGDLQHVTILSGSKKQTVECPSNYYNKFGTLILKNESEEGVEFNGKISVGTLFDHNRKVYSILNGAGSSFVDYDRDGKKDNVDRFPTIKDISAEEFIISEVERQPFQGTAIEPEIIVKYGDETLLKDVDYKVSYSGNDRPGTATVSIDGLDNFTGSVAVEFEIYCDHHFGSESTTEPSCTEAGTKTMVCDICGQTVTEEIPAKGHTWNKEYTVDQEPTNTEEGLESIHCSVCGEIKEGTQRPVAKLTKSVSTLTISGITAKTYNGKAQTQAVVVKDGDTTLEDGADYTVTYKNNTNAGTASIIITGIGNYSDSVTKTFTIKKIANTITAKSIVKSYSAQVQTFDLGVKVKNGTPTYKSDNKSVTVSKAGKVTVKAKFIGNANITITSPASTNYTSVTKKIVVKVMPTKTKFTSVTNVATKKMKLTWVKRTNATGYIIQYSASSTFDSAKTVRIDKYTTVSTTIGNLVKGKKYYVRIKTFKTVSGTKYYSGWSEVMSVKIAK